jgi:D-glycerate 3-kinase
MSDPHSDPHLESILNTLAAGQTLSSAQYRQLVDITVRSLPQAFHDQTPDYAADSQVPPDITTVIGTLFPPEAFDLVLQQQIAFIKAHYWTFKAYCQEHFALHHSIAAPLWHLWLPLALGLKQRRDQQQHLWIQGIVGLQGTGKTTLTGILSWILQQWGYRCLSLSLDDLYLPYSDRVVLQHQIPCLVWRGPPGTHDVALGLTVLQTLRSQTEQGGIWVPRFDKSRHEGSGDRGNPDYVPYPVDIVLFEGWFVGMATLPEDQAQPLQSPLAQYSNQALQAYQPLWNQLDGLLVLHLLEVNCSKVWRKEAEQKMKQQGRSGLADQAIDRFVEYFWEALPPSLFLQRFVSLRSQFPILVITLDGDRTPQQVNWYR